MKKIKIFWLPIFLIFAFVALSEESNAQQWKKNLPTNKTSYSFFDYQRAFNQYWAPYNVKGGWYTDSSGNKTKAKGWKQFKREEAYWEKRVNNTTGEFPKTTAAIQFKKWQREHPQQSNNRSVAGSWTSIGPSNVDLAGRGTGRINCISFDPANTSHYWVGAPAGGIWETTDNGVTWAVLSDSNPVLGVSDICLAQDYNSVSKPTIYIATGDRDGGSLWGQNGGQSHDNESVGILKTTDGGATWNTTGLTFAVTSHFIVGRLIAHPTNNTTLWAATSDGIYMTTDAGVSWTQKQIGKFIDMEMKPGDPTTLYASTSVFSLSVHPEIYRSTDGGNTWTVIKTWTVDEKRCELAVSANDPTVVYAAVSRTDYNGGYTNYGGLDGVYRSQNSGASFTLVYDGTLANHNLFGWKTNKSDAGGQGSYDLAFDANPANVNELYIGGVNTFKSTNANGGSPITFNAVTCWTSSGFYNSTGSPVIHADHHCARYRSDGALFDTNDGGVYFTTNGGSSWTERTPGLVNGQIYGIGVAQSVTSEVVGGFQDNGTKLMRTGGANWFDVKGGDGMNCAIDMSNNNNQYGTYAQGQVDKTTNNWTTATSINAQGAADWAAPLEIDPAGGKILYFGDEFVRRYSGTAWTTLSASLSPSANGYLQTLSVYHVGGTIVVYAGDKTKVWKSNTTAGSYVDVTSNLPTTTNVVTDIEISYNDPNHAWVTMGGYDGNRVYETTNGGGTWTNISTGLPNLPCMTIVQNDQSTTTDELYVGTDVGIYIKRGTANWQPFSTGLPNVVVSDLEFYYDATPANSILYAATFGRGVWKSDPYSAPLLPPTITTVTPNNFFADKGKTLTIVGTNLTGATAVIGGVTGTITANTGTQITVDFPAGKYLNNTLTVDNGTAPTATATVTVNTRNTIPVGGGTDFHTTIQSALDGLNAWKTIDLFVAPIIIDVYAGTYAEKATLNPQLNTTGTNTLTIQNHASDIVIVDATGLANGFDLSTVNNVLLKGFSVHSANTDNIYAQGNNVTIQYNKSYSSVGGSGIKVATGTPFTITNNLIYSNYNYGIHIFASNNAVTKNNTAYDNGHTLTGPTILTKTYATTLAIPDNGCPATTADGIINVPEVVTITKIRVLNMNITHTYDGDLQISLVHPDATVVALCTNRGASGNNFVNTGFDDAGAAGAISAGAAPFTGIYIPEALLSAFNTKPSNGNWILRICDNANVDTGSLTGWQLEITYTANETIGSGLYVESGTGTSVENNIFEAKAGTGYYALQTAAGITVASDFNTYFKNGNTNLVNYNGALYANFAAWPNEGTSDLETDPTFVTAGTDFHIFSTVGSYHGGEWPPLTAATGTWTVDASNSTALDAGNTVDAFANEPQAGGRINQGCYGNTVQASKSAAAVAPTITNVTPNNFFADKGKTLTITGTDLLGATVTIGTVTGTISSNNGTTIVVVFPPEFYSNNTLTVTTATAPAATATVTVNKRNIIPVGGGTDFHTTIQSALDGLAAWYKTTSFALGQLPGAKTIDVYNGTYTEIVTPDVTLATTAAENLIIQSSAGQSPIIDATTLANGVYIGALNYVQVLGFTVHGATSDNIYTEGDNNIIAYNKVYGSTAGSGILLNSALSGSLHHNLVYSNYSFGLRLILSDNTMVVNNTTATNGHIAKNVPLPTVYDPAEIYVESGTGIILKNNIFYTNTGTVSFAIKTETGITVTSDYNTYFKNTNTNLAYYNGGVYANLAAWPDAGANDIETDPDFFNIGIDFHLNSTVGTYVGGTWSPITAAGGVWTVEATHSPAIDAGNTADAFANEPVSNGSRINQGCYGNTTEASLSASAIINWDGSTDTNWQDITNWTPQVIPTSSDQAIIPNGMPNYPVIDNTPAITAVCATLDIASSASVTLAPTGQLTVGGLITNAAGVSGLVIQSDATGTGSLIQNNAGISATVNNFLSAPTVSPFAQWHMFTPPIATQAASSYNQNNFYYYDESTVDWWLGAVYAGAWGWKLPVGNLNPAMGYFYYFNQTTLNYTGTLNYNVAGYTVTAPYTFSVAGNAPNGVAYTALDGWTFTGNPHTCAIDWDAVTKSSVNNTVYYYDDNTHNYKYYNGTGTPVGTQVNAGIALNGGSRYIPAMQGFFVKTNVNPTGGSITIPNSAKVHNTQAFWRNPVVPANFIRMEIRNQTAYDESVVRFKADARNDFDDAYDAYKRFSLAPDAPQLYSIGGDLTYAINSLPQNFVETVVPLGIVSEVGDFTLNFTEFNFTDTYVYLIDKLENKTVCLNDIRTYAFATIGGRITDRFELRFTKNVAPIMANAIPDQSTVLGETFSYTLNANTFTDSNNRGLVLSATLENGNALPVWLSFNSSTGVFSGVSSVVEVLNIKVTVRDEFGATASDVFILTVENALNIENELSDTKIEIFPNPSEGLFYVTISENVTRFSLKILSISGQEVFTGYYLNNGTSNIVDVSTLAKGVYFMDITLNGDIKIERKIVIQ